MKTIKTYFSLLLLVSCAGAYGTDNTFYGDSAGSSTTTGSSDSGFGANALTSNTTGSLNTAVGHNALRSNVSGSGNTAFGSNALLNTSAGPNNAFGNGSLSFNTVGTDNCAFGNVSLANNINGNRNCGFGDGSLLSNSSGSRNTAIGFISAQNTLNGNNNIALGDAALYSNVNGSNNIAIGTEAGFFTTGSYNITIAHSGVANESNTIRIGTTGVQSKTFIAGINNVTVGGGVPVYISSLGQLGTLSSSLRYKDNVKTLPCQTEKLLQLRPVSFTYKNDETKCVQYGLIAEEVERVMPDLVVYDQEGTVNGVHYMELITLLLGEVQHQHQEIKELKAMVQKLSKAR